VFVRVKNIKGNRYAYLVENTWQPKGSRQTVKAYLGKVLKPEMAALTPMPDISSHSFPDAVLALTGWTLANHGFQTLPDGYAKDHVHVSLATKAVRHKQRNAAVEMNEGYLCDHTLTQALNFVGEGTREEEVGQRLANTLLEAGISVPQETFVMLFNKIFKPLQES